VGAGDVTEDSPRAEDQVRPPQAPKAANARAISRTANAPPDDPPDRPAAPLRERDTLLATKLRVPRGRADLLARPGLLRRLEEATDRELLLVSAPPGFGKSTLLGEWARHSRRAVAWLSLDPEDNDPARFWRYVVAAIEPIHPGLEERVVPLLHAPDPPAPEVVAAAIVNELAADRRPFALVLDDYHVIESPAIHESLAFLLRRLAPGLRVVIAGRSDPPLALALLRARGQLAELRVPDLRFTAAEAAALLRETWGLDLPVESVAALAEKTEGWVAGLQLAALALQGSGDPVRRITEFAGSHRYILDYLTEEVLERQPEEVRSFLLETSVLERLSGPLCDAVTGRADGQQMLENLERANLFLVALDDERRWYRYHRLFADLLRVRLRQRAPERAPVLHRKAAAWCEAHGLVEDAIRHALAGGDAGGAAEITERHIDEVLGRGEGATLRRWLAALPPEVVRARPGLALVQAIAAFNAGQLGAAAVWLDDAERSLHTPGDKSEPSAHGPESALGMIPATISNLRASLAIARGEPERARGLVQQARALLSEKDRGANFSGRWNLVLADWMEGRPAEAEREMADIVALGHAGGAPHLALSAGAVLGRVQRSQGRLGAALRTYRQGLELGDAIGHALAPSFGVAYVGIAEVLYERDQLDDALHHVNEGIELCRRLTSTQPLAIGLATLAWIRRATGDPRGAREAMEEAYRVHPGTEIVSLYNPVPAERAQLLLAEGEVSEAAGWVAERGLGEKDACTYAREQEYLVLARLLLARDAPDSVLGLLGHLRAAAEAEGRTGSVIEIRALEVLALAATGDPARALTCLAETLALARTEGYVRVFADEGPPMAALLGRLAAAGGRKGAPAGPEVPADYLARLLRTVRRAPDRAMPAPARGTAEAAFGWVGTLTERELEVLGMLAAGSSNREIAEALVVSLDTVKKHVTHILEKLGAANRTQAVARAKELGLIP
jgi:LuxR family maltose regulon positive regulatory protein